MANSQHIQWLLEGCQAWNNRRSYQDFVPDFRGVDLASILLEHGMVAEDGRPGLDLVDLSNSNLIKCNLSNAWLQAADFIGSDLGAARFDHSQMHSANLTRANLQHANFEGADLTDARLGEADLRGCKLDNARLARADLIGANLSESRFWTASLRLRYAENWQHFPPAKTIGTVVSIDDILKRINELKTHYSAGLLRESTVFYFRGESETLWELAPSVMRKLKERPNSLRHVEGDLLVNLRSRRAQDFAEATSALDQMVIARHHGLPTRLLDVTHNPLVALFNASEKPRECPDVDGRIHVFAVPRFLVKQFNSDTVSVITNFARLRRREQNLLLGKTVEDCENDVSPFAPGVGQLGVPFEITMNRLYQFIRLEKPSFQERINPIDLLQVIVVEPEQSFERIRAQSGAFLLSAFHERLEESEIRKRTADLPTYHHYTLAVPWNYKNRIREDLATFNITRETMLPGLDEAAKAVTEYYEAPAS